MGADKTLAEPDLETGAPAAGSATEAFETPTVDRDRQRNLSSLPDGTAATATEPERASPLATSTAALALAAPTPRVSPTSARGMAVLQGSVGNGTAGRLVGGPAGPAVSMSRTAPAPQPMEPPRLRPEALAVPEPPTPMPAPEPEPPEPGAVEPTPAPAVAVASPAPVTESAPAELAQAVAQPPALRAAEGQPASEAPALGVGPMQEPPESVAAQSQAPPSARPGGPVGEPPGAVPSGSRADGSTATLLGGGAGPAAGGIATPPAPPLDTSSSESLLDSLAMAPASGFGEAVGRAKDATAAIHERERADLEERLPRIEQPTGMTPRASRPRPAAGQLPTRRAPAPAEAGPRRGQQVDLRAPEPLGPVPGTQVGTTPVGEPASDEGGSWWSWLTDAVQRFLGSLPTTDSGVITAAGPAPEVDLTGAANPAHNAENQQASDSAVARSGLEANSATSSDFGDEYIAPTVHPETLRPSTKPRGAPAPTGRPVPAAGDAAARLPRDMLAQFDEQASPAISAEVRDSAAQQREERATYERSSAAAQLDGQRQIAAATRQTRQEQEGLVQEARKDVAGRRGAWRDENQAIEQTYRTKASARRSETDAKVRTKVETTHREADAKLAEAEHKARQAKEKAELRAEEKKRQAQSKPKSWWERARGAISSAFDAIEGVITGIFDELRSWVKQLIEEAKAAVRALIDAARDAIAGFIRDFAEFVEGLVTIALAAFPEAAARARAWIEKRVEQATDAVNRAAEGLKNAADAVLDAVGLGLDLALSTMQQAFVLGLDLLEVLANTPFEAIELLVKIVDWIEEHTHFIEGAQRLMADPDSVIQEMKATLGEMIAAVPEAALSALDALAGQLGPKAQKHERGIRKYLVQSLDHLRVTWWDELKKMGWTLLWPWPSVWGDVKDVAVGIPRCLDAVFDLRVSEAVDEYLAMVQKVNSILGAVYGWFFIASVLVGAIIGAFFGGVGALPGALAGAAFAGEVGEGLVLVVIATEGAIVVKSAADLAIGNDRPEEDEQDYQKIAGSTLTIAITGAMMLLGELAADLAKAIWNGAKGLFKSAGADAAADTAAGASRVGSEGVKGGELPEGEASNAPEPAGPEAEVVHGEKVVATEPTADGHSAKVTEEGTCLICSTCEEVAIEFKPELDADVNLKTELDAIVGEADPAVKAKRLAEFEKKLVDARTNLADTATPPEAPTEPPSPEGPPEAAGPQGPDPEAKGPSSETAAPRTPADEAARLRSDFERQLRANAKLEKRLGDIERSASDPANQAKALKQLQALERDLVAEGIVRGGQEFFPERGLLEGGKHGLDWTEGPARAVKEGKPQGQFGSPADVQFAVEQGSNIGPGKSGTVALPESRSFVHMPDGTTVPATKVFVKVYPSGKVHAFPLP